MMLTGTARGPSRITPRTGLSSSHGAPVDIDSSRHLSRLGRASLLCAVLLAAGSLIGSVLAAQSPTPPTGGTDKGGLLAIERGVRSVVVGVGPSVVTVVAVYPATKKAPEHSYVSSGIVMDRHGRIVTAADPIQEGCQLVVETEDPKGKLEQFRATLVGRSADDNVAVIKVLFPPAWLHSIRSGRADRLVPGSLVFALTRAYRLPVSCSLGFVTGLDRKIATKGRTLEGLIVTSGIVARAGIGGVLANVEGEAVAMLMSTYGIRDFEEEQDSSGRGGSSQTDKTRAEDRDHAMSSATIKFSMPIQRVLTVANRIVRDRNGGGEKRKEMWRFLGVRGEYLITRNAVSAQLGLPVGSGFLVKELFHGEAAARAGIQVYDVILELGRHKISSDKRSLGRAIWSSPLGRPVPVLLMRAGRKMRLEVRFGPGDADREKTKPKKDRHTKSGKSKKPDK